MSFTNGLIFYVISSHLAYKFQQLIKGTSLTNRICDNIEYPGFVWEVAERKEKRVISKWQQKVRERLMTFFVVVSSKFILQ